MPYRPSERQYRDFAVDSFQPEVRESSDDQEQSYSVRGYFCTFREPYELFPDYYEEIDPQAFVGCDMSDVILQVNHDGFVYARNRNGSLQITTDDHGGHCVADLSGSKRGREELFEAINNGLIDRMSFGFTIADDGFEWDEDEQGVIHTRITKISKLYDVSPIAGFPANDGTEISARSLHDSIIEARNKRREIEQAAEHDPEPEQGEMCELTKPAFTDEELDAIADALERRAMERRSGDPDGEKEERELPDFLKDDDDDEEKRESDEDVEERDCDDDELERIASQQAEEQRAAEEAVERAHRRRMRRARAMALTSS